MHGLINRALQCFVRDTYGPDAWLHVARGIELDPPEFESMLHYDDDITGLVIDATANHVGNPRETVLEDIGTYLVSHPNVESLRRLLRFGGVTFIEFLHSLDDLPDRARLAVPDLELPLLELREVSPSQFSLTCSHPIAGWGFLIMGLLRTIADDYGALVFLEHHGTEGDSEVIDITLIETAFAEGRDFDLGARAG